jgi:hypothetical protein
MHQLLQRQKSEKISTSSEKFNFPHPVDFDLGIGSSAQVASGFVWSSAASHAENEFMD